MRTFSIKFAGRPFVLGAVCDSTRYHSAVTGAVAHCDDAAGMVDASTFTLHSTRIIGVTDVS